MLGFPTANMKIPWSEDVGSLAGDAKAVLHFAENIPTGIYAAYASVEDGHDSGVYKVRCLSAQCCWCDSAKHDNTAPLALPLSSPFPSQVAMSVGWNPTFTDVKAKTIEPWILHDYPQDFYGCNLRLLVAAYIRPEVKFESFDELIAEIKADGEYCSELLEQEEFLSLRDDAFFKPLPKLPSIDAVALQEATESSDQAVQNLRSACLEHGFFVIDNHKVPTELIDRAFGAASSFFELDEATKQRHGGTEATNYRGIIVSHLIIAFMSIYGNYHYHNSVIITIITRRPTIL